MSGTELVSTKTRRFRHLLRVALGQQEIGRRIHQAREDAGLTQSDLADLLGLGHPQSISRYERGETEVPQKRLRKIAEVTGKPLSYFVIDNLDAPRAPRSAEDQELQTLVHQVLEELRELRAVVERLADPPTHVGTPREHGASN